MGERESVRLACAVIVDCGVRDLVMASDRASFVVLLHDELGNSAHSAHRPLGVAALKLGREVLPCCGAVSTGLGTAGWAC